jgi:hypothetical protein
MKLGNQDRVTIVGTKYDKRAKLTADEKEEIKRLYEHDGFKNKDLAKMFEVSAALITFVCNPGKSKEYYNKRKAAGKIKKYKSNTIERTEYLRKLRAFKRDLLNKGELQDHFAPKLGS